MEHVVLYNSYRQALSARKKLAESACASLGVTVTTPEILCEELWNVWGDGRSLVTGRQRLALALAAVRKHPLLVQSVGMAQLLGVFVDRYAHCLFDASGEFNTEQFAAVDLHEGERAFLCAAGDYFASLRTHDFIELGQACCLLSQVPLKYCIRIPQPFDMHPAVKRFLGAWIREGDAVDVNVLPPLSADITPGFLFPAGPTAVVPSLKEELLSFFAGHNDGACDAPVAAAVFAPNAATVYEVLASVLVQHGVTCELHDSVRFLDTSFGRAFCAAYVLCGNGGVLPEAWKLAATDFAYSAWSGMQAHEAQRFDTDIRGDRLFTKEHACDYLCEKSATFGIFRSLFEGAVDEACVCLLESDVVAAAVPASVRVREASMVRALCELVAVSHGCELSGSDIAMLAETLTASVSLMAQPYGGGNDKSEGEGSDESGSDSENAHSNESAAASQECFGVQGGVQQNGRSVCFMSLGALNTLPAASYDLVVVADVTEDAFPLRRGDVSLTELAAKLGIAVPDDTLARQRQRFGCAMAAARTRFTCVMPLHDESKEVRYPAFLLDEYIAGITVSGEAVCDQLCGVPQRLIEQHSLCGEDAVATCLGCAHNSARSALEYEKMPRGTLLDTNLMDCMSTVEEDGHTLPVLSPSALERYVACPYGWFIERFVRLNQVDECFGPLEQGNFVHEVFAAFYGELARRGITRVDTETLDEAQELLDRIFDERLADTSTKGRTRLAPLTQSEHITVERLRAFLHESVQNQALLDANYVVREHEKRISPDDGITYAGVRLNGRVDRIDVDEASGCFMVFDYKGNSTKYAAGFSEKDDTETYALPEHIQTLVYAQALRSCLEQYTCAGALYLSYRAKVPRDMLAGSYNPLAYDAAGMAAQKSQVVMNFSAFLDMIEDQIRPYVAALVAGDIAVRPTHKHACDYCPFPWCEKRK